ncbi:MAG: aldo/keto reductase [Candidatus Hodarchaeota archaeon]
MKRVTLGKTGLEVNRLAFGSIPIQRVSEKEAVEVVLHAVEMGVDYIDTARGYTTSEYRIGKALQETDKKVVLATKSHERTSDGICSDIEKSLKELQRDYIDIYQCHLIRDEDDYNNVLSSGGAFEGLIKAREEGLIGHIGVSSHSLDIMERIVEEGLFETIMVCFSILESAARERIVPKAIRKNLGVIAMKPFSGGVIEDPVLALKYVLNQEGVLVLAGVEKKELFDQNWEVFQGSHDLIDSETKAIEELRGKYDKSFCRRCDYCQPCTEDIPIQFVLGIRSLVKRSGRDNIRKGPFMAALEKAKDCCECGECEERCPYDLPIRDLIKKNLKWAAENI